MYNTENNNDQFSIIICRGWDGIGIFWYRAIYINDVYVQ